MEIEAKIANNPICIKIFKIFLVKKSFLVSNWNVGQFDLSFDVDIVHVNHIIVNILHFCSKSWKNFFSSNGATLAGSNENFMEDMVNFKTHIGT